MLLFAIGEHANHTDPYSLAEPQEVLSHLPDGLFGSLVGIHPIRVSFPT